MTRRKNQEKPSLSLSKLRVASFYLVTLTIILMLLSTGELALRFCVPAPQISLYDPYVSFSGLRPLFVLDPTGTQFETAEERLAAFRRQSFAAKKRPEVFRVFCLGGSTVQGRPYSVETSFTTWLELNLRAARPDVDYEIVNCGGISYASYRLVPILQELLNYEPDAFIICTGHNEFIEDRTYQRVKKTPHALLRLHRALLNLRGYALADQFLSRRHAPSASAKLPAKTVLQDEVRTKLDLQEGLESYRRDEIWRQGTVEHFRHNLDTMLGMARRKKVPVILVNPVSNLKDCPPFKSEPRADLTENQRREVAELREQAARLDWGNTYGKISLLEKAAKIDNQDAGLLFVLGRCYARLGRSAEAKKWFVQAKEEDVCPLRILEPMHEAIRESALRYHAPLVDVRALIEERTEDGIPGDQWLLDHAHPTIEGHQLIADALYRTMVDMKLVPSPEDWRSTRDELWRQHFSSLNEAYYAHGAARLKRLEQWSRGRIPKE